MKPNENNPETLYDIYLYRVRQSDGSFINVAVLKAIIHPLVDGMITKSDSSFLHHVDPDNPLFIERLVMILPMRSIESLNIDSKKADEYRRNKFIIKDQRVIRSLVMEDYHSVTDHRSETMLSNGRELACRIDLRCYKSKIMNASGNYDIESYLEHEGYPEIASTIFFSHMMLPNTKPAKWFWPFFDSLASMIAGAVKKANNN